MLGAAPDADVTVNVDVRFSVGGIVNDVGLKVPVQPAGGLTDVSEKVELPQAVLSLLVTVKV